MPRAIPDALRIFKTKRSRDLTLLYAALLLLSVHWAIVIYINSSFLGQFVPGTFIGLLYGVGSLLSLLLFFHTPSLLHTIGNYKLTIYFATLEILAVVGMALAQTTPFAIFFFLLHFILMPMLLFNLDIFIEEVIGKDEKKTGSKRGLYLCLLSLATAVGPLLTGFLSTGNNSSLASAYVLSSVFLLPFLFIICAYFKNFENPEYSPLSLSSMTNLFKTRSGIRTIVIISLCLQLFFTWMVIYTPLYLAQVGGFSLYEIGLIMFVGLSAYVIFEYPIGIIADTYIGEKKMMAFGFLLLAISTSWFAFLPQGQIGIWMFAMFVTRVGASFVEATSESYFFKHTGGKDADAISLFRMTRPLSSLLGAGLGSIALLYMDFNLLFIILGFLMVPGLFFTLLLKDTK
jgi:MFS family permease